MVLNINYQSVVACASTPTQPQIKHQNNPLISNNKGVKQQNSLRNSSQLSVSTVPQQQQHKPLELTIANTIGTAGSSGRNSQLNAIVVNILATNTTNNNEIHNRGHNRRHLPLLNL